MSKLELLTQSGYDKLKLKVKEAMLEREQALSEISDSKQQSGELSENSEFIEAKDRFDKIEIRIQSINSRLMNSRVIEPNEIVKDGKVRFGSVVKLIDLDTSDELTYQILGEDDADIKMGIISYKSPIATAMIGKLSGDQVYFITPRGDRELEVISVDGFE